MMAIHKCSSSLMHIQLVIWGLLGPLNLHLLHEIEAPQEQRLALLCSPPDTPHPELKPAC